MSTEYEEHKPVIVVGGGLSGLVLSRQLDIANIDHVVFDTRKPGKYPCLHYLTSRFAASKLGIESAYQEVLKHRTPITGYVSYNAREEGLQPLEELEPNQSRDGFVTFSFEDIASLLNTQKLRLNNAVKDIKYNGGLWHIETLQGISSTSKVVVDATGARAAILQKSLPQLKTEINSRLIRVCFGGVYPYFGSEELLLFADGFQEEAGIPQLGAGWIMPLGDNLAEVVIGGDTSLGEVPQWRVNRFKDSLECYIDWFNNRGIRIDKNHRCSTISGYFSQGLLDFRKLDHQNGLVAFGESLGLNHPLNGYLVRDIADYAQTLAQEISSFLSTGNWDPYRKMLGVSRVNYGIQTVIKNRKLEAVNAGLARTSATEGLQRFLVNSLGQDGFWELIDGRLPKKQIALGMVRYPQFIPPILGLGFDYLKLLRAHGLFRAEFSLKIGS